MIGILYGGSIETWRGLHPSDVEKFLRLGKLLHEVSSGRLSTRYPVFILVRALMCLIWPDDERDDVDDVVTRLLAIADHRRGAEALSDAAFDVFLADPRTAHEAVANPWFRRRLREEVAA